MRIAQIVVPPASEYDRKAQRIDRVALSAAHEVIETTFEAAQAHGFDVAHVYGPDGFAAPPLSRFPIPYLASGNPRRPRFPWPRVARPAGIVSPLHNLPEAVEDAWFEPLASPSAGVARRRVGTFGPHRPGVLAMVEQTLGRIERVRDDVEWVLFDRPPSPSDLAGVDAWCDPAVAEDDFDGYVAEATVAGKAVVAARTEINSWRLDKGRSGWLVPVRDPNELTHAILAALFKPEVAELKIEAARQTAGKFRARQRLRALEKMYESLIP